MTTTVLAFDVNETLLHISVLDEPFRDTSGDASYRGQWFAQVLQLSFVCGLTGSYLDSSSARRAAFRDGLRAKWRGRHGTGRHDDGRQDELAPAAPTGAPSPATTPGHAAEGGCPGQLAGVGR